MLSRTQAEKKAHESCALFLLSNDNLSTVDLCSVEIGFLRNRSNVMLCFCHSFHQACITSSEEGEDFIQNRSGQEGGEGEKS